MRVVFKQVERTLVTDIVRIPSGFDCRQKRLDNRRDLCKAVCGFVVIAPAGFEQFELIGGKSGFIGAWDGNIVLDKLTAK